MEEVNNRIVIDAMPSETLFDFLPLDANGIIAKKDLDPLVFLYGPRTLADAAKAMVHRVGVRRTGVFRLNLDSNELYVGIGKEMNVEQNRRMEKILQIFGDALTKLSFSSECDSSDLDLFFHYCPRVGEIEWDTPGNSDSGGEIFLNVLRQYKSQLVRLRIVSAPLSKLDFGTDSIFGQLHLLKSLEFYADAITAEELLSVVGPSLEVLRIGTGTKYWPAVIEAIQKHCEKLSDIELIRFEYQCAKSDIADEKVAPLLISYGTQLRNMENMEMFNLTSCKAILRACPNMVCSYSLHEDTQYPDAHHNRMNCIRTVASQLDKLQLELNWKEQEYSTELALSTMSRCTELRSLTLRGDVCNRVPNKVVRAFFVSPQYRLEKLKLKHIKLNNENAELIAQSTCELRELILDSVQPMKDATGFGEIMKSNRYLRTVAITERGEEDDDDDDVFYGYTRNADGVFGIVGEIVHRSVKCDSLQCLLVKIRAPRTGNRMDEIRRICLPLRHRGRELNVSRDRNNWIVIAMNWK